MPNDGMGLTFAWEPQTVNPTTNEYYSYDQYGFANVLYPIYNIWGYVSRYEKRRIHRYEIEEYNKKHPKEKAPRKILEKGLILEI